MGAKTANNCALPHEKTLGQARRFSLLEGQPGHRGDPQLLMKNGEETTMADLRLTMGCWDYDRTRGVMDGSIKPDGINLTSLNLPVEETFFRMLRYREFDIAEMSLSLVCRLAFSSPSVLSSPFPSFRRAIFAIRRST
jgi:hypothetical protein